MISKGAEDPGVKLARLHHAEFPPDREGMHDLTSYMLSLTQGT